MHCSYYLFDDDRLGVKVTSEVLPSGTEEVGIDFTEFTGENMRPSYFTIKFRGKAFDRAIELAQDLSDKVIEAFKKSRREDLGLKENLIKGGDSNLAEKLNNPIELSVLNSQNKGRTR
jgi:hypothetical protein